MIKDSEILKKFEEKEIWSKLYSISFSITTSPWFISSQNQRSENKKIQIKLNVEFLSRSKLRPFEWFIKINCYSFRSVNTECTHTHFSLDAQFYSLDKLAKARVKIRNSISFVAEKGVTTYKLFWWSDYEWEEYISDVYKYWLNIDFFWQLGESQAECDNSYSYI